MPLAIERIPGTIEGERGPLRIFTLLDVTARHLTAECLQHLANHDPLTGLPNRGYLEGRFKEELARCRKDGVILGVAALDLDGFKPVNDTYGHAVGDALLVQIAQRLSAALRISDVIARVGGDEFIGLFPDVGNRDSLSFLGERLLGVFDEPFEVMGHLVSLSGSIGLVVAPADGEDQDSLLKAADEAMYRAKQAGKRRVQLSAVGPAGPPDAPPARSAQPSAGARADDPARSGKMRRFPAPARPCPSNPLKLCTTTLTACPRRRRFGLPRAWALVPALVLGCLAAAVWASGRNTALFQGLNAAASGLPAALWAMLTVCGSVLGAIALLAPTLKTQPRWLASAFLAAPLAVLFSEGSKRYFDVLRPAGVLAADSFNLIGQKLYVHAFPSGHSTTAFVAAAAIVLAWPQAGGAIAPGCWCSARPAWSPSRASRWAPTGRSTCSPAPPAAGCAAPGGLAVGRLRFWEGPGGVRAMATVALATSLALFCGRRPAGRPSLSHRPRRLGHRRCRRGPHAGPGGFPAMIKRILAVAVSAGLLAWLLADGAGAASARCSCASTASPSASPSRASCCLTCCAPCASSTSSAPTPAGASAPACASCWCITR
jgi:diguanylate cyclase (GGDEF)-like protein